MEWIQALTIIASLVVFISIVANLLNKRIDDVNRRLDKIEEDIREIRQLFYKFFEVPKKESE
ncbi:MAG: hypothetical protein RQ990_04450 [Candidatus Hydrothermia bacterium]|jgi:uncharacterized protein YoxC|nr:hypothetical protein [Candidatus Hydrothermia bacterium]